MPNHLGNKSMEAVTQALSKNSRFGIVRYRCISTSDQSERFHMHMGRSRALIAKYVLKRPRNGVDS